MADSLENKEYESFLPLYRKSAKWSDRIKVSEHPLFPGYVFCRGDFSGKPRVVTTPGVIGILGFAGVPATITDQEIDGVKTLVSSGLTVEPWSYLRQGEHVLISSGPLAGLRGLLIRAKRNSRLVLSVEALCRSVAIEVSREQVVPIAVSGTMAVGDRFVI